MKTFIDTPETTAEDFLEQLRQADLVLLTFLASSGKLLEQKLKYLQLFEKKRKLILISGNYQDLFQNIVALDNTAVGEVAADALNQTGCSNVLILGKCRTISVLNAECKVFTTLSTEKSVIIHVNFKKCRYSF